MVLALDISTTCTGWAVFSKEGTYVKSGFIKLNKIKDFYEKCKKVQDALFKLVLLYSIDLVVVEENLQAFRPGLSSAKTLMTLARFNGIIRWMCHADIKCSVLTYNVNSDRKAVGLKIDRKSAKTTKEQVLEWVTPQVDISWPTKVLKSGPNKGKIRLCDESYDMADAFVVGKAHFLLKN